MHRFYDIKNLIAWVFFLICIFAQCLPTTHSEAQLYGLWLGVHIESNPNFPLAAFNEYRADGTMSFKQLGKDAKTYIWSLNQNILTIDTMQTTLIAVSQDTFINKGTYRLLLRRVKDAPIEKDEGELRSFLKNTSWLSEDRKLHFDKEKIYTESEKGLTEIRCWNIEKYNDYAFLYQTGYWADCDRFKGRAMQIIKADDEELHLSVWNEADKYEVVYTKEKEPADFDNLLKNRPFQLCNTSNAITAGDIGVMYKDGGTALKNHFYDNYKITKNIENENGLLILKFIINCEGESGKFEVVGVNNAYENHDFHTELTNQILQLGKSLEGWTPFEHEGENYDSRKKIKFRITNGQIKIIL